MRRVLLLIAGLLILGGIAVPLAAGYYLIYTEEGLRFLTAHVPHRIGDVQLDIAAPGGTIAHGFNFPHLEIDHPLAHLTFTDIQGRVELLPLLLQTIQTDDGSIGSITIQARRRTRPVLPGTPQFLPRWLIVNAARAHVGSLHIISPTGGRLDASDLEASAVAHYRKIRILGAAVNLGSATVSGEGTLQAEDPLRANLKGHVDWRPAGQPSWSADVATQGNLDRLAVTGQTSAPYHSGFSGFALDLTRRWHWFANSDIHDLDVTRWSGGKSPLGLLSGHLTATGNPDGFNVHGPLESSGLKAGLFDVLFEGSYSDRTLWAQHMELTHRASGAHVMGAGSIAVSNGPRLDLHGTWRDFRWPLLGGVIPFHSASGEYSASGTWPYALQASGLAQVQSLPPMPVKVDGALGKDRFTVNSAGVDLYGGHADLSGIVIWSGPGSWSLQGHVADVDPGQIRDDLPGRLTFSLQTSGQRLDSRADFSVAVRDISGRLRGVAASGGGKVTRTRATWQFDGVRLQLGGANAALDGRLDDTFDLRFALAARDLSLLKPDSEGQLESSGTIRGSLQAPVVAAHAHGKHIRHDGLSIDEFETNIDFDPALQHQSHVEAGVHNLSYAGRKLDVMTFRLHGTPGNYSGHLDAHALGLSAVLKANGPFANGTWHGMLTDFTLQGTESLHLELEHPTVLALAADNARLEPVCLQGRPASLCGDVAWSPADWKVNFAARELPLATLTAGMTQAVDYGGRININGQIHGAEHEVTQGSVRADLTDAQLTHRLASGRRDVTQIGSGVIAVTAAPASIELQVGLESGEVGTIRGELHAARNSGNWQNFAVHGNLHAHTGQLGLITLYVPDIDRAAGHLDADMNISGTLGTPLTNGELKIADGEIDYYALNLGLRQVAFEATLNDNGVDFNGYTRIGSGTARARGRLEWHNSLPYGKVHVDGTNLRVVDVPEAQIDASPALEFAVNGRRIEATGSVTVPAAKIAPADLTGAVRASSDEVIVGAEQADPSQRFEVVSNITLNLTDKVSIDTNGLSGKLTGSMTVRSGYEAVTSATGELSIGQGKYTAYARKLDIQKGRLIFSGGPIGNPGIDIRAIKEFPDVTAGINVRGTLLQPRISFFSDPSLTQSQIASLILSGGSLESTQGRQSGAGYEALAQGGAILAQQIGSRVGIEDVSLESDLTNQTSLVLGRYLSPRLYVSYGVALTEQLNVLKLRYSLGDRWTIKTEVGQARGADLVYTIQR
jgi:translocation and assembly module TamB